MIPTNRLVPEWFKRHGLEAKLDEHRLIQEWPDIVGPQVARHAVPTEVRAKTLRVAVDSSPWLHELTMLKPVLMEKVARRVPPAVVRDILFVIGEVPAAPPAERPAVPPAVALDPADEALLDAALVPLTDPDVRASVRRLLARALAAGHP